MSAEQEPFSIDLGGRISNQLELHEQLTIYFDAMRTFIAANRGMKRTSITHTLFSKMTGIEHNKVATHAREHIDMVVRPPFKAGPLHYTVLDACVTPLGAQTIIDRMAEQADPWWHVKELEHVTAAAIAYVRRQAGM